MNPKPPAQPNASLISGLNCLHWVATTGRIGGRELARRMAMEPTRAHRLLKTLASQGYLLQDETGRYEPGPAMHLLSARSLRQSGLLARAMPALETLAKFRSVVALGMLWRTEVVYLFHSRTGESIAAGLGREPVFPATKSSIGLALLARRSRGEIDALYPETIPGFNSREALHAELSRIRETGCATAAFPPNISIGIALDDNSAIALGSLRADRFDEGLTALRVTRDAILHPDSRLSAQPVPPTSSL